jgi:nitrite reductase/ring-hydroxylating ferredoxin subunit
MRKVALALACWAGTGCGGRLRKNIESTSSDFYDHREESRQVEPSSPLKSLLLALNPDPSLRTRGSPAELRSVAAPNFFPRARCIEMGKDKGFVGKMPGKSRKKRSLEGETTIYRKLELGKKEWVLACDDEDLGQEEGAMKTVEAGKSPTGDDYLWVLTRGKPVPKEQEPDDGEWRVGDNFFGADRALARFGAGNNIFAMVGNCPVCTWPMSNGKIEYLEDGMTAAIACGLCGTKYSLETGEVVEWLPGDGPVQWTQKQIHKDKKQDILGTAPTRLHKGKVYVRLPEGTLTSQKYDEIQNA